MHMPGPEAARSLRRRQVAVGVVGLAAVLSGGTFAVSSVLDVLFGQVVSSPAPAPSPVPRAAPSPTASSYQESPDSPSRSGAAVWTRALPTRPSTAPAPRATAFVDAIRPSRTALAGIGGQTVTRRHGDVLRVVWARRDMTGLRELAWIADSGFAVGDARCTQRFRYMAIGPAVVQPKLLMCWRTSAAKSVYTVAVSATGRPSAAAGVAALDARWDALG